MDEEQEELSTYEASQKSGMSQGYLASLLRQHKLEGSYDSKRRRWMVNVAAFERFLTIEDKTGERRITYAKRLEQRAQQAVQEGQLAQAESLYLKALTLFDYFHFATWAECRRIRIALGHLYSDQQRYAEAEAIFLQVLNDAKSESDLPSLYALLTDISNFYTAQDRFADAQLYLEQKRKVAEKYRQQVNEQIERARMLMDQQKYWEAAQILMVEQHNLEDDELLDHSTKSALIMANVCFFILCDTQENIHGILRQLQSFVQGVELDDAEFCYRLAENFCLQRRYWEAKTFFNYALKLFEQDNGQAIKQLQIVLTLKGLGQVYYEQENYREAEASYQRALSVIESLRGTAASRCGFCPP